MKTERIFINYRGDQVKPFTNEIIKKVDEGDYKPTKEEIERVINLPKEPAKLPDGIRQETKTELIVESPPKDLTIQQQIEQAEKHLVDLKLKKKDEIARMKAELAKLENS